MSKGNGFAKVLSGAVVFLALYQGAVPLVARLLFDADQRVAPALWLPSPWWWITCIAIVAVAVALLGRSRATHGLRDHTRSAASSVVGRNRGDQARSIG